MFRATWNRLVKVVKPVPYGTATVTYTHDMLGRRITETTVAPTMAAMAITAKDSPGADSAAVAAVIEADKHAVPSQISVVFVAELAA